MRVAIGYDTHPNWSHANQIIVPIQDDDEEGKLLEPNDLIGKTIKGIRRGKFIFCTHLYQNCIVMEVE